MHKKEYWHELEDEELSILLASGITWKQVQEKYLQPKWCGYPNALSGQMGCWSLTSINHRAKICEDFCKSCDEYCGN